MIRLISFFVIFFITANSVVGEEAGTQPVKIFNKGNLVLMSNDFLVPVFAHITPLEFSGATMPPDTFVLLPPQQITEVFKVNPIGQGRWTAVWNFDYHFGNPYAPDIGIRKFKKFIKPSDVLGKIKKLNAPIFRSNNPFEIFALQNLIIFNIIKNQDNQSLSVEIYNLDDHTWVDYNFLDAQDFNLSVGQSVYEGMLIGKSKKINNSNFYSSQVIFNRLENKKDSFAVIYKWLDFEIE